MKLMKDKIEITQADMLKLLAEKIEFLEGEYVALYEAFEYKGRGKTKSDPIKISKSHERFLKERGDIQRILKMYRMFETAPKTTTKKPTTESK